MKRLLSISLLILSFACRESTSQDSQTGTTAVTETSVTETSATVTSATETTGTTTPPPVAPEPPAAPVAKGPKLMPVDEATKDPSLVAFRDELLAAVRKHDTDAVVALADPKIRTSFGGGGGAQAFRRNLGQPGVWEDLERILTQGGSFQGESFWAPYVYSAWPDAHDVFSSLAITGDNVPLRESADSSAPVVATLSYDIVQREGDIGRDPGPWQNVKTADAHTGWVESRFVRSPVGYRAGFLKNSEGKWRMNALVAGD